MRIYRRRIFSAGRNVLVMLVVLISATGALAQNCLNAKQGAKPAGPQNPSASDPVAVQPGGGTSTPATASSPATTTTKNEESSDDSKGQQTKRILWIIPNYRAVSANCQLPSLRQRQIRSRDGR
jgi:hypothetical protein